MTPRPKDGAPKSAYEIAMEKLRRTDAEKGIVEKRLTTAQKEEIARIRSFYGAKRAEREILFKSEMRRTRAAGDPEAVRTLEENYRRDLEFFDQEMESKIRTVREGAAGKD